MLQEIKYFRNFLKNSLYRINTSKTNQIVNPKKVSKDIVLGKYCDIGNNSWICPKVCLGNYVMIAPDCAILGGDHKFDIPGEAIIFSGRPDFTPKTIIEDDVWIGFRVTINAGITIGRGSIIASSSVVTKNVPPYSIMGGNPAKLIKYRFNDDEQKIHENYLSTKPKAGNHLSHKKLENNK